MNFEQLKIWKRFRIGNIEENMLWAGIAFILISGFIMGSAWQIQNVILMILGLAVFLCSLYLYHNAEWAIYYEEISSGADMNETPDKK